MDYIVLFDVATKPRAWLDFPWPFFVVMLTVFFIVGEFERDPSEDGFIKRNGSRIIVAIVLIMLAVGVYSYETDREKMIWDLANDNFSVVTGEVSNVTYSGRRNRRTCFTVASKSFCYDSAGTTPALNGCSIPISPDLSVRVSYKGKHILRLEATQDSLDLVNAPIE
jgi:hypothetical protein